MRLVIRAFAIILALLPVVSMSRTADIRTEANLYSSNITSTTGYYGYHKLSLGGGLIYDIGLSENMFMETGIKYMPLGFFEKITFTGISGNPIATIGFKYKFNYVGVPLQIGFKTGNKPAFFASAGIIPAMLIYKNSTLNGNLFDISLGINTGIKTDISSKIIFISAIQFQKGFIPVIVTENAQAYNYAINISAGIGFKL